MPAAMPQVVPWRAPLLIGGTWIEDGDTFPVYDKFSGEPLGDAVRATRAQVDEAVTAAALSFEREPLDPTDGLWAMKNVVLTPHSSGFRASHWDDVRDLFAENLRRYRRGEELLHQVDLVAGY